MLILGIDVDEELFGRWRGWVMPEPQPCLMPRTTARELGLEDQPELLTPELLDTFELYGRADSAVVWVSRATARGLPEAVRRGQRTPHRWPVRDGARARQCVVRFVERGRRVSRHREVGAATWRSVREMLPGVEGLAGTFPSRSGPNCFGAVLAAAGVPGAGEVCVVREPFEEWLAERTVPGGRDVDAGTVLVWRNEESLVEHAVVTMGDGWAFHKPSQGWMSPYKVLRVPDAKYSARAKGLKLHRHRLV